MKNAKHYLPDAVFCKSLNQCVGNADVVVVAAFCGKTRLIDNCIF